MSRKLERTHYQAMSEQLEARLLRGLRLLGWNAEPLAGAALGEGDFVMTRGNRRYLGVLRISREARRPNLEGALADAFLRARAATHDADGHLPLALVGAPRISPPIAGALRSYGRRYGGGVAFGLVDAQGKVELWGEGLEESHAPEEPPLRAAPAERVDLFSDRNQWLLKVLLAPQIPGDLLAAPRQDITNASQLAKVAQVSVAGASRLVLSLRAEELLAPKRRLELTRQRDLLTRWRSSTRRFGNELSARWLIPSIQPRKQLTATVAGYVRRSEVHDQDVPFVVDAPSMRRTPRVCLGLFSACELLGFSVPHGAPQHVYVEEPSLEVLEQLGLTPAKPGEAAHVVVRRPRFPESVFRGAVTRRGVPVADALQCLLDVADHPARGAEVAEQIRLVLFP